MTYAKLSGALLARKDAHVAEAISAAVPAKAPPNAEAKKMLAQHLKALKLQAFLSEFDRLAEQCAAEGLDHSDYLLRLAELELVERERQMVERRIKAARFPAIKSLESFDFAAVPSLNKNVVMDLARSEYIAHHDNILIVGDSGTGKTHIAIALGLAACQQGFSVGFITASSLMHQLMEADDERRQARLKRKLAGYKLLIIDELGFVPLSLTAIEILSQRYESGSTLITSGLPFAEWSTIFGSERLTAAVLDRLTHNGHVLEIHGESYRLKHARQRRPHAHANGAEAP